MSKESNSQKLPVFNLKKYIKLCFKSWRIFVLSVIVCGFLAGVYALMRPPKEEVFAQLMLKDDTGGSTMMMAGQIARSFALGDMFGGSSTTDNETFVLKSHTVFLNTVKQLDLNTSYLTVSYGILKRQIYSKVPYKLVPPQEISDTLTRTIKFDIKRVDDGHFDVTAKVKRDVIGEAKAQTMPMRLDTKYGTFVLETTEYFDPDKTGKRFRILFSSYDAAASSYERIVKIFVPDRKSDFINLSFATTDPKFGKELLGHIITNYVDISNVYNADRSAESLRLVDDRLASLASELLVSENALESFKKANNLTDVEIDAQYLMSKTGTLESALLEAQTNYEVVKLTRDFIKNPENNYSLIPDLFAAAGGISSDNGANLISQYNELILQRMQLMGSAKGNNSTVKQLDMQIDALRDNIITTIDRLYQNVSLTLRDLNGENSKNKSRLSQLPTLEREYIVLKRDNLLQEQIYLFLLQQREELNMSLASRSLPAQVIDAPYVLPDPAGLSRKVTLALGVILGLILAAVYVFFFKMRKCPITSRKEFEDTAKVPTLQYLADDTQADKGMVLSDSESANLENFSQLRADVVAALKGCKGNVVAVTSMHDGEGKTYVSVNLAASLARIGHKVVLVDAAFRTPAVADRLGIKGDNETIFDYIYEGDGIKEQNVSVGTSSTMAVIPTKEYAKIAADMAASQRFAQLISDLKGQYDYVVIDSSRIEGYSDIYAITDLADVTLIVCRSGVITADDINTLDTVMEEGRLKRMAIVENAF